MNNPQADLGTELRAIAKAGFDFLDLTLDAGGRQLPRRCWLRSALQEHGLRGRAYRVLPPSPAHLKRCGGPQ